MSCKSTNFICLKECSTKDLPIDPKIFRDKIYQFKRGGVYTIYGEIKDTKAIYDETMDTHDYEAKFRGWITKDFIQQNFIDENTLNIEIYDVDCLFKEIIENEINTI